MQSPFGPKVYPKPKVVSRSSTPAQRKGTADGILIKPTDNQKMDWFRFLSPQANIPEATIGLIKKDHTNKRVLVAPASAPAPTPTTPYTHLRIRWLTE